MTPLYFLTFLDFFTKQALFSIAVKATTPNEGCKIARCDQRFKWLAAKGTDATAKQYDAVLEIVEGRPVYDVPILRFDKADDFLTLINHVNSRRWNATNLKRIRYAIETANLKLLRQIVSGHNCVVYPVETERSGHSARTSSGARIITLPAKSSGEGKIDLLNASINQADPSKAYPSKADTSQEVRNQWTKKEC